MSRLLTDFPMKKKRSDDARHIEGWQSKNERIESLLNVLYDFRFNTVKSRTEYRAASSSDLYQPVTKFVLNSFRRRLDATAGIVTSAENIRTILESDFARKVHPIREYFNALPLLNPAEHGHIGRLLNTVQVANPGKWEEYFTKWLIGVVANAMNDTGCQNHTCLVLTGDGQGQFKSWWLDNLCPTPLKNYLFTGKIDPQGKDILYKAFSDAGRTDEDRDFTLNADAGIILNDAGMGSCLPNLRWILEEMDKLDKVAPYDNGYTYRDVNKVTCWPSRKGSAALLCMDHESADFDEIVQVVAIESRGTDTKVIEPWGLPLRSN